MTVKDVAHARVGLVTVFLVASGAAMCGGCAVDAVIQRASREFTCPRQQIEVIDRGDISDGLYDLDACGSRARYMCVQTGDSGTVVRCVHEPDPPKWDPDPALVASLPRPTGMSSNGRMARICREELFANDCLKMEGGAWRWYHRVPASGGGGLGTPGI